MDRMRMESIDMTAQNIEKIGALFPNCITETKDADGKPKKAINFDLLRQMLSGDVLEGDEAYEFTWVGKKAAIVEANKPIRKTLRPCKEESVNWDSTENLYIEGDNLEVLKLLQESYLGKVKMIYIDPPYNTGNDFIYRDDFKQSAADYEEDSGVYDEDGNRMFKNSDTNGRFHSDWCSMIYSRLMLARNLLTDDGVIFISIDDNEQENLKKCCSEVFGGQNFVAQLVWERAFAPKNDAKFISNSHDYILMYAKNINQFVIGRLPRTAEADARYSNPDNDPRGVWQSDNLTVKTYSPSGDYPITTPSGRVVEPPAGRCWSLSKNTFLERLQDNRIWFGADGNGVPRIKRFLSELKFDGMAPTSILFYKEVGHSQEGSQELIKLMNGGVFDGPKPTRLLKRLITLANLHEDSIVLDFFSGSATTAQALMKVNAEKKRHCKFIMVQLSENANEKKETGYKNICEIGKERIRRAGAQILERSLENLEKEGVIEKYAGKLSKTGCLEEIYGSCGGDLSTAEKASERGNLCVGGSDATGGSVDSIEHCRGTIARSEGIYPVFESGKGITCGTGNTIVDMRTLELLNSRGYRIKLESLGGNQQDALCADKTSWSENLSSKLSVLSSDHGFRVLKLDDTNMKDVYYAPTEYEQSMLSMLESNIKDDRTDLDLLFGCLLEWGLPLSLPYQSETIEGCTVHNYNDGDLIACFDDNIPDSVIKTIAKRQPLRAVFRDSSFASSPSKINVTQIFKELAPDTSVKVL